MAVVNEDYRTLPSGTGSGKQSLLVPAIPKVAAPFPRSLVQEAGIANQWRAVRATPLARPFPTPNLVREEPAREWSVVTLVMSPLAIVWLDDPTLRAMPDRRSIVIKNHDPALGVWIKQVGQGVGAGGYLGPGESIGLPLGPSCNVFCLGINPVGSNVSFYQLGG
jgi:hypothetical protein